MNWHCFSPRCQTGCRPASREDNSAATALFPSVWEMEAHSANKLSPWSVLAQPLHVHVGPSWSLVYPDQGRVFQGVTLAPREDVSARCVVFQRVCPWRRSHHLPHSVEFWFGIHYVTNTPGATTCTSLIITNLYFYCYYSTIHKMCPNSSLYKLPAVCLMF